VPGSELAGFPGQLDLVPEVGTIALGDRSYLVYPRTRHGERTPARGELVVCLVVGERAPALRATLARLRDPTLPGHHVVAMDGGSDDWSLADAIADAATGERTLLYRAPSGTTLGVLYRDALELVGSATAILVPVDPELAAAALTAFADALARHADAASAIAGSHEHLIHGETAAAAMLRSTDSAPMPLMALRGPVATAPSLAACTTPGGVALALCAALRPGHSVVAPLAAIDRRSDEPVPLDDVVPALRAIAWPASSALRHASTHRLGRALQQSSPRSGGAGEILATIASAMQWSRGSVAIEHPSGLADEDTQSFAAALDRAGITIADGSAPEPASWGIRWAPPGTPRVDTTVVRTAVRLSFHGETLPADLLAGVSETDALLVPSELHAAACRAAGVGPGKLTVVPPVVDTTVFRPGLRPIRLGKDDAFTFLLVTRWDRAAGWKAAVSAYARSFTARDPVSLVIVVAGPEDVSEAEVTADILAAMGAARPAAGDDAPDISLQTTRAALDSLPSIYAGADCLISPAADVLFERSAIEAMACGVPVSAPIRPALAPVLDQSCGFPLVPGPDMLDAALALAASDRVEAAARGAEARRRCLQVWSGDVAAGAVARALGV
jgi:hypothetical protein